MLLAREEKVETVLDFGDLERVLVHAVLEDELLEVQERPLVVDFLSDLDEGTPGVLGGQPRALLALSALDDVLDLEDLLQNRSREDLCVFRRGSAPVSHLERRGVRTSFWIVNLTRNRFECGSVQMKPASMSRTLERPLSFRRQIASSSRDSSSQRVH